MCAYTAYVIYLSYADRFPQANVAKFCPPPDRKDKKADDYRESMGQLGLDPPSSYDVNLHYAIAHMRRADGALPPMASGKKMLDLLAGKGQPRCVDPCEHSDALPECVTAACAGTIFGPTNQSMAGGFTTCGTKLLALCSTQFTKSSTPGLLRVSMSSSTAKSVCKSCSAYWLCSCIFCIFCFDFAYSKYFCIWFM